MRLPWLLPLAACAAGPDEATELACVPSDCAQALVVVAEAPPGCRATLAAFERRDGAWHAVGAAVPAVVGRNGVIAPERKREGDGCTPGGVHRLGHAFGYAETVATGLAYRQATADDYWVDDPASPLYNRWVRGAPGVSAERMRMASHEYELGAVIEWNTAPVVPGRGSAIFFHVWGSPDAGTAGCVAVDREAIAGLLAWLRSEARPCIVVRSRDRS
ncbi:MAG: hypothetical protein RL398_766 [Planctomycetota bacterium]|jgi:L,D-peptidoglycan transpeptidase YkuD (ErfK/YbiS/YcfS/YnhG family)